MIKAYYGVVEHDDEIDVFVTEKKYYDKNGCLQDDDCDPDYDKIERAMAVCGYPREMESCYQCLDEVFNHEEFVKQLFAQGIHMIRNEEIEEEFRWGDEDEPKKETGKSNKSETNHSVPEVTNEEAIAIMREFLGLLGILGENE